MDIKEVLFLIAQYCVVEIENKAFLVILTVGTVHCNLESSNIYNNDNLAVLHCLQWYCILYLLCAVPVFEFVIEYNQACSELT